MGIIFWILAFLGIITLGKILQIRDLTRSATDRKGKPAYHYDGHAYRGPAETEIRRREIRLEKQRTRIRELRRYNRRLSRENKRLKEQGTLLKKIGALPVTIGVFVLFSSGFFMGVLLQNVSAGPTSRGDRAVIARPSYPIEEAPSFENAPRRDPAMCLEIDPVPRLATGHALDEMRGEDAYLRWLPVRAQANAWYWPYFQPDCVTESCWLPAYSAGGEEVALTLR